MEADKGKSDFKNDPKPYLDYLDKEMTFCGIITTFSLACVLFMMDKLFSTAKPQTSTFTIDFSSTYFVSTLLLFTISAYLLFRQRAELAFYYGQISLEFTSPGYTGKTMRYFFNQVDSWKFWYKYFYGIALIACAFIQLVVLIVGTLYKGYKMADFLNCTINSYFISPGLLILCLVYNYFHIKNHEKKSLPHDNVYTRIGISQIPNAGVGIIAIKDIPKDTYIFFPDDDKVTWIDESKIDELSNSLKKLYLDFCVKKGKKYGCPINFNKLTPAWYLNNSNNPNVYADSELRFKALRDIKEGEELTSEYSSYSDSVEDF